MDRRNLGIGLVLAAGIALAPPLHAQQEGGHQHEERQEQEAADTSGHAMAGHAMEGMGGMHARMATHEGEDPAFLEVSAQAAVDVPSDRARIRFAVETEGETAADASRRNAARMDAVLSAVRELGITGMELETSGYALSPIYTRPERGETRRIEGYRTLNHVEATLLDVTAVGRVIDAGIDAGANRVAGLVFEATDTRDARLEAIRAAVEEAREEAETIAAALGVELGRPLEVRGGAESPSPHLQRGAFMMEMAQVDAPTPVEPGEQTVRASVTIRFALPTGG